jgi:hypothetical protein
MRDVAMRDPIWAGVKFGMTPDEVQKFVSLPLEALERLAGCCDRPLFQLAVDVKDLSKLVATPAPVASLMVASRAVVRRNCRAGAPR